MKKYIIFCGLLFFFCSPSSLLSWHYVSFDESMKVAQYKRALDATEKITGIDGYQLYFFMRSLYERLNPAVYQPEQEAHIPKIIHQIWLGSPVPESFKGLMQAWVDNYVGRGWQYRLWTDADIEDFGLYNKEFYDATTNYGVKSDILKWEIIYRYGGVYVDVDYEPLAPLDQLHEYYSFYVGIQPLDAQFVQLGAALFAAIPGHPILKHCIETIKDDWHHHGAPKKTGPVHFTKSFYALAGKNGSKDIALPASYLYPLGCLETKLDYDTWKRNGAYAIHHWAKSWMPKNYRPQKFQDFDNRTATLTWND